MIKYFDVHTHTNYEPLDTYAETIANNCLQKGIYYIDIGTDVNTSRLAVEHSNKYTNVYACVGIHPTDVKDIDLDLAINEIEGMLNESNINPKIVAIGETGLDYHYEGYNEQIQKDSFIRHIRLAKKFNLPLMVHVRDAHEHCLKILKEHANGLKVIIHCFSGNEDIVRQYLELGYWISIPGIITFKKSVELQQVIKLVPLNKLLSETDAPWLSPEPHRGEINSPEFVPFVVNGIAKALNKDVEELNKAIVANAIALFNIKI